MIELTPREINYEPLEIADVKHWVDPMANAKKIDALRSAASIIRKVENKELVPMPPPQTDDSSGLKVKYRVYHAEDNTPVEGDCFVLRPDKTRPRLWRFRRMPRLPIT